MVDKAIEKLKQEKKGAGQVAGAMGDWLIQLLELTGDRKLAERICDEGKKLAELAKDMEAMAKRRKKGNMGWVSMEDIYAWYGAELPGKGQREPKPQTSAAGMVDLMDMDW